MANAARAKKGTVSVTSDRDRLRLGWRYKGERYFLFIGLPDTVTNRRVAEAKASQIELDMMSGHFDPTLRAYKLQLPNRSQLTVTGLFNKFIQHKSKTVVSATLDKYRGLLNYLEEFFKTRSVAEVSVAEAEKFSSWYDSQDLSKVVIRERLGLLKACWEWGIEQALVESNPWVDMPLRIKVPPKQMPKPFTEAEIKSIVEAFKANRYYRHYVNFVEFRFGSGCRTGEIVGLRWKHISEDCSTIWIGEALIKGKQKATKTNRSRYITLTSKLQTMLQGLRQADSDPNDLVFKGPKGAPIDAKNFAQRGWQKILTKLGIDYQRPYNTRHALISHALDKGMNPVEVAQLTGHDVQTLYRNYAGNVNSRPRLPEI
ncbi:tyrosine-type recombinase/integrase [Nodosilinea nodulosa]|uniref:tyrosine-type recombinase/integrase n=1 Tax=Nodosilinea nodulosa TaxID=416001 RepID=UPI000318CCC4|nr:tyrosine-type recombinase/integrase [Nodosilinea nodulosa]